MKLKHVLLPLVIAVLVVTCHQPYAAANDASNCKIVFKNNQLTAHIENIPAQRVLNEIHAKTGVDFIIPPSVSGDLLSVNLQSSSLKQSIQILLHSFNYIAIVDVDGKINKVIITGESSKNSVVMQTQKTGGGQGDVAGIAAPALSDLNGMKVSYFTDKMKITHPPSSESMEITSGSSEPMEIQQGGGTKP